VSIYYDPMIAKLVVWGEDRRQALRLLAQALSQYRVAGLSTNIDFLYNLSTCAPFVAAELDTGFIDRHRDLLFDQESTLQQEDLALASLYLLSQRQQQARTAALAHGDPSSPWHSTGGWRMNEPHLHRLQLCYREQQLEVLAEQLSGAEHPAYRLHCDDQVVTASGELNQDELFAEIDGYRQKITVAEHDGLFSVYRNSGVFQFSAITPDTGDAGNAGPGGNPRAPMNGTIVALLAEPGVTVEADTPLLVMEAMKMEHTIRADSAGRVTEFYYQPGELVDGGAELLDFAPQE
jgi:3-methylcrotonyl-CoA carboxylase alpha subunit